VETVKRALGTLKGKKIAALGLAYKPDVDDLRESPANEVVHILQREGAQVLAWEPFKPDADTVHGWDSDQWQNAGFHLSRLGVGK
jgi:UDP-N-acetyl-D-mannosaminuronic acid dehydrogenase